VTNCIDIAKRVLAIEARAIADLSTRLDRNFPSAVRTIFKARGRLIVCGMGKSGIIARKISATMTSTGTPSHYMHPSEALHGDLGMVTGDEVFLILSYSGMTDEILQMIPHLDRLKNPIISMTGNPASFLARHSRHHLNVAVETEACPLRLAPTASTTAALAMGDALAVALMEMRGFKKEDFAIYHPGGSLGRRLLTRVSDVMLAKGLPILRPSDDMRRVIETVSAGRIGLAIVVERKKVVGMITDGDLRKALDLHWGESFHRLRAEVVMTHNPHLIRHDAKLADAEQYMLAHDIHSLLVVARGGELAGVLVDEGRRRRQVDGAQK
jgi:arabinose-5-phosphate isomerase